MGGMGMAIARRLGERHRLLLVDRDRDRVVAQAAQLAAEGHDATYCVADVTSSADVTQLAAVTEERGPLAVLAHVVGLSPSMGTFREIVMVDLVGAALVEQAIRPVAAVGTAAVFVSSNAGHRQVDPRLLLLAERVRGAEVVDVLETELGSQATPGLGYVLSKAAVVRMCQRQAAAWGERGARIVSISPGMIATPMGALEFERTPMKHELLARTPLQREGTMLEIADVVEFLTSDRASYITGTDLMVDGGLTAVLRSSSPDPTSSPSQGRSEVGAE